MNEKKCTTCGQVKDNISEEFPWLSNKKGVKLAASCKVCVALRTRRRRRSERVDALWHYSEGQPRCECCGDTKLEFLTFDHVNNDGAEQRRNNKGISHISNISTWLRKNNYPNDIRVLCYNCNCSIGFYGYCPHQDQGGWFDGYNTKYEGAKSELYCTQGHPMFGDNLNFWNNSERKSGIRRYCRPCEAAKRKTRRGKHNVS